MRNKRFWLSALCVLLLVTVPVQATIFTFNFPIDGDQTVPFTGSPGTGTGVVNYDDVTNELDWDISFDGLVGTTTASHFHGPAAVGDTAGVQVNIGAVSGLASPMIGDAVISAAQGSDLLAGLWYVNIHSTVHPSGEIRGQVVPEPVSMIMLGLGGLSLVRRRQPR